MELRIYSGTTDQQSYVDLPVDIDGKA